MAREKKPEDPGPSKLYLLSFGDTMTTLLAFFIVLCSMATEQTGANSYSGTGSFVNSLGGGGGAGIHAKKLSSRAVQMSDTNPLYPVPTDDPDAKGKSGPDEDNELRSINREKEELQRFLNEMDRLAKVEKQPNSDGEVVFDLFERLNKEPPYFNPTYNAALSQVIPLLRRPDYRTEIIVWSKNPGPFAMRVAFEKAAGLFKELSRMSGLSEEDKKRLSAEGRPWAFSDHRRPVLSIVVRRVESASN